MNIKKEVQVLIVEDDSMVREMIQKRVEQAGYKVIGQAADGRQAVEMTQSLQPDAVLMDIEMPDMDGLEATRRIYELCPTPVVMLTAYETSDLVKQAGQAGAGAYLTKMPQSPEIERAVIIAMARFEDMMGLRHLNTKLQARNGELQTRNKQLQAALDKVKQLSGLLPICANCKKIRNNEGYWQDVAVYIRDHSEADFSHGVCPGCMKALYSDFYPELKETDEDNQDILAALKKLDCWVTLEDISATVQLPESDILGRLQNMAASGQIRQMEEARESFYRL